MKRIALCALILLTACSTPIKPENLLVKQMEYVIKIPPAQLMELPQQVPSIDVDNPNLMQSDIAKFIAAKDKRELELENKLIGISKFFVEEQVKLDDKAKVENK